MSTSKHSCLPSEDKDSSSKRKTPAPGRRAHIREETKDAQTGTDDDDSANESEANDEGNASANGDANGKGDHRKKSRPRGDSNCDNPGKVANGEPFQNGTPSKLDSRNPMPYDEARREFCRYVTRPEATAVLDAKNSDRRFGIHTPHAALTQIGKLWDRGGKPIKFTWASRNGGNDVQRKKVMTAIKEWERYGEIHFAEDSNEPDLVIAFDSSPNAGSWSYVGTDSRQYARAGDVTMNLGWMDAFEEDLVKQERAVILHEVRWHDGCFPSPS
jgi:hypothetical protein